MNDSLTSCSFKQRIEFYFGISPPTYSSIFLSSVLLSLPPIDFLLVKFFLLAGLLINYLEIVFLDLEAKQFATFEI